MKTMHAVATVPDDFDPTAIAGTVPKTHNQSPFDAIKAEIEDLFMEACNWADGEPIADQATHDAIERLYDGLHAAGKKADELRVAEKKPLDDKIKVIQDTYNPLIAPKKGKVDLGKSELGKLLAVWRVRVAAEKQAEADRIAKEAADATRLATIAIQASAGNLAARAEAEEQLADSKKLEKTAARTWKAATTGTGLRTVWTATCEDAEAALNWAYERDPRRFEAMVQQMADEVVKGGERTVPGFRVWEDKVAATGRAG